MSDRTITNPQVIYQAVPMSDPTTRKPVPIIPSPRMLVMNNHVRFPDSFMGNKRVPMPPEIIISHKGVNILLPIDKNLSAISGVKGL